MVADFNVSVDLDKVPKRVQEDVDKIRKLEDKKSHITDKEFNVLTQYFAQNFSSMNMDTRNYIQGVMLEYQQDKEKDFEENEVTKATKKQVQDIKELIGKKGKKATIDSPVEAKALQDLLFDVNADLNPADRLFIQSVLIKSGYGQYLYKEVPTVNVVIVNPPVNEESTSYQNIQKETEITKSPTIEKRKSNHLKQKQKMNKKDDDAKKQADKAAAEADRSRAEADRSRAEADRSRAEADRSRAEADRAKKEADKAQKAASMPKVSERGRTDGFGIVNNIQKEQDKFWTSNTEVQKQLDTIDETNAYSFVGMKIKTSENGQILGDIKGRITYLQMRHLAASLLNQATKIKANKNSAWTNLKVEYDAILREIDKKGIDAEPDDYDVKKLDKALIALYDEMSKVYK